MFFQGLTHGSMLHNYVCIHTDVGTPVKYTLHAQTHTHVLTPTKSNKLTKDLMVL